MKELEEASYTKLHTRCLTEENGSYHSLCTSQLVYNSFNIPVSPWLRVMSVSVRMNQAFFTLHLDYKRALSLRMHSSHNLNDVGLAYASLHTGGKKHASVFGS